MLRPLADDEARPGSRGPVLSGHPLRDRSGRASRLRGGGASLECVAEERWRGGPRQHIRRDPPLRRPSASVRVLFRRCHAPGSGFAGAEDLARDRPLSHHRPLTARRPGPRPRPAAGDGGDTEQCRVAERRWCDREDAWLDTIDRHCRRVRRVTRQYSAGNTLVISNTLADGGVARTQPHLSSDLRSRAATVPAIRGHDAPSRLDRQLFPPRDRTPIRPSRAIGHRRHRQQRGVPPPVRVNSSFEVERPRVEVPKLRASHLAPRRSCGGR